MNLFDGPDLLETTSTEVKNRILKPGQMLRAIDTGALYYGDKDGKPTAFVGATTTSSGGVEFNAGADAFGMGKIYPLYQTVDGLGVVEYGPTTMGALAAGTTASQSGTTVTVICGGATPVAHNIAASENGSRIVFPGSSSIPQGIYENFQRTDTTTFTFSRSTSATVVAESVNAGAAFTAKYTVATRTVRGKSIGKNGRLSLTSVRGGHTLANFVRLALGGTELHAVSSSSAPSGEMRQTIRNRDSEFFQVSSPSADGALSTAAITVGAVDTSVDQTASMTWQCSAAQGALWMPSAEIEIVRK